MYKVTIITGATGSGKTTQVPQYILEDAIDQLQGPNTGIICTQPRRIAAISVSKRVAHERGEQIGATVGYRVRMQQADSHMTRLLFVTPGVLLRHIATNPDLKGVSHLVFDEIHERTEETDLLLVLLKHLLARRPELKAVLMSATLDSKTLSSYFPSAGHIEIPGVSYPVDVLYLDDALQESGLVIPRRNQPAKKVDIAPGITHNLLEELNFEDVVADMEHTMMKSLRIWREDMQSLSSAHAYGPWTQASFIAEFLSWLHKTKPPGAILCFCAGFSQIQKICEELEQLQLLRRLENVVVVAVHGQLDNAVQDIMFRTPPEGIRKIVLATNIAETSLTINDVTIVVDTGLHKVNMYNPSRHLQQLTLCWIPKASAHQRSGRAGRVQPGTCYRLYPRQLFDLMDTYLLPEILRTPLENVCLHIKASGMGLVHHVLKDAMDPPAPEAIDQALHHLRVIGALHSSEELTPLGLHLAQLPVDAEIGKLLTLGVTFDCLSPVLTLAAFASISRSPFRMSLENRNEVREKHRLCCAGKPSDHWALINVLLNYMRLKREKSQAEAQLWCSQNFLAPSVVEEATRMRLVLARVLIDSGFLPRMQRSKGRVSDSEVLAAIESHSQHAAAPGLLQAVLVAGYYPNLAAMKFKKIKEEPDLSGKKSKKKHKKSQLAKQWSQPCFFTSEDGQVQLHGSSLVQCTPTKDNRWRWLIFGERTFSAQAGRVALIQNSLVAPVALLLFAGSVESTPVARKGKVYIYVHNSFIEFTADEGTAAVVQGIRAAMDKLFEQKFVNPSMDPMTAGAPILAAVQHFLACADKHSIRY